MVKKTVDKSHRQNVKQEVHVKVHIGDHKKHKRRRNVKRHAAPQQGSNNIPPQTHAFTPVYIQSGEAPHLQPQANPLVEAIKGIHEHIAHFTGENPLVRHHSQHKEQTPVPIDNYSTPFSRNNLSLHHTQHGGRSQSPDLHIDEIPPPATLTPIHRRPLYMGHGAWENLNNGTMEFTGFNESGRRIVNFAENHRTPPHRNNETPSSLSDSVHSPFVVRNVNTTARSTTPRLPEESEFRKHPEKGRPQVKNAKGNWIFTDTAAYKKAHPER